MKWFDPVRWYGACLTEAVFGIWIRLIEAGRRGENHKSAVQTCRVLASDLLGWSPPGGLFWAPVGWIVTFFPVRPCMSQLLADVPGTIECFPGSAGGEHASAHHLLAPGLLRSLPSLPSCWHDSQVMSDSSFWTVLSNFSMPHFLTGARLRRSKRYWSRHCVLGFLFCVWFALPWILFLILPDGSSKTEKTRLGVSPLCVFLCRLCGGFQLMVDYYLYIVVPPMCKEQRIFSNKFVETRSNLLQTLCVFEFLVSVLKIMRRPFHPIR